MVLEFCKGSVRSAFGVADVGMMVRGHKLLNFKNP